MSDSDSESTNPTETLKPLPISTRPPVTPHEGAVLQKVVDAIAASETFYAHGKLAETGTDNPVLLYTVGQSAKMIPLVHPTTTHLNTLHQDCEPSGFGRGDQLVMDESYRLARELLADRFGLNFGPLAPRAGVLSAVSAFCKSGIEAIRYKLNSYTEGGHFKAHRDTPKGEKHIGTLLIGLPIPYSGGELILRHTDQEARVDWSTEGRRGDDSFLWVFLYSDVEHEILPVTSGHRLTLAYDVYTTDTVKYTQPLGQEAALDVSATSLHAELVAALQDSSFLPNGGRVAFALAYEYPSQEIKIAGEFNAILKGGDNILWQCVSDLNLQPTIKAVYKPLTYYEEYQREILTKATAAGEVRYEVDEYSCLTKIMETLYRTPRPTCKIMMTAKSFAGIPSYMFEDTPTYQLLQRYTKAKMELDVIWAKKPSAFAKASTFISHGNQPEVEHLYVAGALMVDIPAMGEGCRIR